MSCPLSANLSTEERCDLIKDLSDVCEGGGYLAYTALVDCEESSIRWLVFAGFVLWLLFLFLAVATVADAFFSPNIAGVVSFLKISENIAVCLFKSIVNECRSRIVLLFLNSTQRIFIVCIAIRTLQIVLKFALIN